MKHIPKDHFTEHLNIAHSATIEGLFEDGVTVEQGVSAEIQGKIVGSVVLRKGARLKISGQVAGPLQIEEGAELALIGMYAGELPESFDGALLASQGTIVNRKVLLEGRFKKLENGEHVSLDASRLFVLTGPDGSLKPGEF